MLIRQGMICCVLGYLLGNISPSFILAHKKGYDIRREGSGNAGATNAFILLGKNAFFVTALLDIAKAFAACRLCQFLFPALNTAGALGGVFCVLGHIYPVFLSFRGGKGLASLGGVVLAWSWKWFLGLLLLAVLIAFGTRYVCVVAPSISVIFPACYYLKTGFPAGTLILLIPALPIFLKHWENFVRIKAGTEMRTSFIWDKEAELKRIGRWDEKSEAQLERRGK